MRIGSLFSGAGGLDLAVQEVFGGEVVWHAEIDKAASKVLAHRFPGVPNLGDISAVDWADVPAVDVLCGGFPCQDVSAAGKRAGIKAGTRSGLWSVFADAIDELRPQWVVIENVRGLLSATAHRTVDDADSDVEPAAGAVGDGAGRPVLRAAGAVLGDLADLGYDAQWATVAAADVGAPHRRERVFIVASSSAAKGNGWDEGRPEPARIVGGFDAAVSGVESGVALLTTPRATDPAGAHSRSSHGFRPQLGEVVRQLGESENVVSGEDDGAVPVLPTDGGGDDTLSIALNGDGVAVDVSGCVDGHNAFVPVELAGTKPEPRVALLPTPNAVDGGGGSATQSMESLEQGKRQAHLTDISRLLLLPTPNAQDGNGGGRYSSEGHQSTLPDVALLPTPRSSDCFGAGQHGDGGMDLRTTVVENASQWGKYAPAIARWEQITGPAPAPTEPNKNGNPRLSAAFSEWLMGWPQGWVTHPDIGISRNDQLRIIGNGVCPQQAVAALHFLLAVSEVTA